MPANWSYPTSVRFGPGRIAELAAICREFGIMRPLFVTDPGLAGLEVTKRALARLQDDGLNPGLFCEVRPNPVAENVEAGVTAFRDGGHDGVIGFGGGSALDVGKAVAFMAGQTLPIWDFEDVDDWWTRADADAIAPVIAVPTTAGTGSEVGRGAVIANQDTQTKKVIFHPLMLPKVALLDPELTVGLPRVLTVGTGMDALAHCIEAFCAPTYHPMAEGLAVEGVRLVFENLPRAAADGTDLDARGQMLVAASMGAAAFQKGLGAVHALSHPIGALYDCHHGMTNAVLLPYVLAANRAAISERIGRLAAFIGLEASFDAFQTALLELRTALDVPNDLKALGVDAGRRETIAAMAIADPTAGGNPVPLTEKLALSIFDHAYDGHL